jgi:hypothetical protein
VLPTPYFHVVFTLPHELSRLVLANRRPLYHLLFQAAWQALRELAADPRQWGAQVGALMVLHTWGQNLEHHPHLHCVMPGGGLSLDGARWVPSRSPQFLLPVVAISRLFRGKFLAGLTQLHRAGQLKLEGQLAPLAEASAWERWLTPLYEQDWVVYVQPPPQSAGPEAVLKYLARYVAGAAISDSRLLSHAAGRVTFRAKNYRQGRKRETLALSGLEFVRRFLLHVLPRGLPRVRYYGLLANKNRSALAQCRQLLGVPTEAEPLTESVGQPPSARAPAADSHQAACCAACGRGRLQLIEGAPRPTWREVLARSPFAGSGPAATAGLPAQPGREDSS